MTKLSLKGIMELSIIKTVTNSVCLKNRSKTVCASWLPCDWTMAAATFKSKLWPDDSTIEALKLPYL